MERTRRGFFVWSAAAAAAGAAAWLWPWGRRRETRPVRKLIRYRWGAWADHPLGHFPGNEPRDVVGWLQVDTKHLRPGDLVLVFNDVHDGHHPEYSPDGYLLWGERVRDVEKIQDGRLSYWAVSGPIIPKVVAEQFLGRKDIVFCGDGKGNYRGCAGTVHPAGTRPRVL